MYRSLAMRNWRAGRSAELLLRHLHEVAQPPCYAMCGCVQFRAYFIIHRLVMEWFVVVVVDVARTPIPRKNAVNVLILCNVRRLRLRRTVHVWFVYSVFAFRSTEMREKNSHQDIAVNVSVCVWKDNYSEYFSSSNSVWCSATVFFFALYECSHYVLNNNTHQAKRKERIISCR